MEICFGCDEMNEQVSSLAVVQTFRTTAVTLRVKTSLTTAITMRVIALPFTVYNGEAPSRSSRSQEACHVVQQFCEHDRSILRLGISEIVIPEYTIMVMSPLSVRVSSDGGARE